MSYKGSLSPSGEPEYAGQQELPFLSPALIGPSGTTRSKWEDQGPCHPSNTYCHCSWPQVLPLPRVPTSTAHLIFCSHFTELYKERTQHGGIGSLVLLVCLFVNLIICKVMFLFLFTLLSSYLTSVWKSSLVTVHFFFAS